MNGTNCGKKNKKGLNLARPDFVDITIEPHTVQSVTVQMRNVPKK